MKKTKVLFVCMGNICRSPTAEGVFLSLIKERNIEDQFVIDSAGTHAFHVSEAPDLRAQKTAEDRGISLSKIRSRKIESDDFEEFDYILAMDDDNFERLMLASPDQFKNKIKYFLDFAPHLGTSEVPDPYYGGKYGFERVLDMVEDASVGFLDYLKQSR